MTKDELAKKGPGRKKNSKNPTAGRKAVPKDEQIKSKFLYLNDNQEKKILATNKSRTLTLAVKKMMEEKGVEL